MNFELKDDLNNISNYCTNIWKSIVMASKRRSNQTSFNFRSNMNDTNVEPKGTKPTREPTSVLEILTLTILFVCKKILFLERRLKIIIYLGILFGVSLIADVLPIPKWYFSRSDNFINRFFVKFAWGWNLMLVTPFLLLTSFVYCCGQKKLIAKQHIPRLIIATFFWWFWTKIFNVIEANFGKCTLKTYTSKATCLHANQLWNGFDISGHSFILIYGSLMLIEEARCIINWDSIKDYLRLEEYQRTSKDASDTGNPLKKLSQNDLEDLQVNYEKYTPYIRGLFVVITLLQIIWDFMLFTTALYYHVMVEKLIGGFLAIVTWFLTYHVWYKYPKLLPGLPGEGEFKYIKNPVNNTERFPSARRKIGSSATNQGPTFMGRPIYTSKQTVDNNTTEGNS